MYILSKSFMKKKCSELLIFTSSITFWVIISRSLPSVMERNWELSKCCLEYGNLSISVSVGQLSALAFSTTLISQFPGLSNPTRGGNGVLMTHLHHGHYLCTNTTPQLLQPIFFLRNFWASPYGVPIDTRGFPDSSAGKESACNAGDPGLIPGTGRSPGEGIGHPLQHSWVSLWLSW